VSSLIALGLQNNHVRSYIKVYYKRGGAPNFADQYYGKLSEVPDQSPDAVLAFKRLRKAQFITNLNLTSYGWITFWGNAETPQDIIPQWFWDNGGAAFQLGSVLNLTFGPWAPGTFFPFVSYQDHPKN
jgi:hypothetical protein